MTITAEQRERGDKLRALVDTLKGKSVEFGVDDCTILAAQWVADITGREIDWPAYSTRGEAERIIEDAGGLVKVWAPVVRKLGLMERSPQFDVPQIGDVGIIETSVGHVGGIWLHGQTFLWRAELGVRIIGVRTHRIVKAWQV